MKRLNKAAEIRTRIYKQIMVLEDSEFENHDLFIGGLMNDVLAHFDVGEQERLSHLDAPYGALEDF